jgi:ABC-type nitrate/sulfonate/bicarbonate transport system substrate-binding protein
MSTLPGAAGVSGGRPSRPFQGRALAIIVAVACLLALLSLLAVVSRAPGVPPEKLRLAMSSTPHAALLHLAAAEGFFVDEGLDVSVTLVTHGRAALDLLLEREVDLAAAAEVPFVVSVLNGQPLRVVASMLSASREMAVVARRDSGIELPAHLPGKRIGVTFGTSGDYFLWAFLTRYQLSPDRISMVNLPPGRMVAELANGTIDAAATWQPVRRQAEAALGPAAVTFIAPDAYTVTHVIVGRGDTLDARSAAVRRFVRALLRAERLTRDQPARAMAVVAREQRIDTEALRDDWALLDFRVDLSQSQLVTFEDQARWAQARGHVGATRPLPNFLQHLHMDALEANRSERVTIVR